MLHAVRDGRHIFNYTEFVIFFNMGSKIDSAANRQLFPHRSMITTYINSYGTPLRSKLTT